MRSRKTSPPKERASRKDGDATRARIQATALELFRKKGFDAATMRDVARAAGVSLGAAYHHFPSKEAIALAFYREHQERHVAVARKGLAAARSLRERLDAVFTSALDVRGPDRPVFAALTRTVLDVENSISLFADETRDVREGNVALMREAATCDEVSEELREPLALALWALELGLLLRFVLDESPGQTATRKLMAGALDLVPPIVAILGTPFAQPMREQLLRVLVDGGMVEGGLALPVRTDPPGSP